MDMGHVAMRGGARTGRLVRDVPAGVWEFWRAPAGGEPLVTVAVLTTAARGRLAEIHDRMPLLLPTADWATWLDPATGPPRELLRRPADALIADLEVRPVSSEVNNVAHNGPELVAAVEDRPALPVV